MADGADAAEGVLGLAGQPRQQHRAIDDAREAVGQRQVVAHQEEHVGVLDDPGPVERVALGPLDDRLRQDLLLQLTGQRLRVQPVVERQPACFHGRGEFLERVAVEPEPVGPARGGQVFQLPVEVVAAGLGGQAGKRLEVALDVGADQRWNRRGR